MKSQDSLFLILLGLSLSVAVLSFLYRRAKGSSVPISVWVGGIFFGLSMAVGVFAFYNTFFPRRYGTGMDILIVPSAIFLVSLIFSGFIAMGVFVLSNLKGPGPTSALSASAQAVLKRAGTQRTHPRNGTSDWREFARESQKLNQLAGYIYCHL